MNKIISFFMAVVAFFSESFSSEVSQPYFKNEYTVPENTIPYSVIDTTPKSDWNADYIWDSSSGNEENVWMCFRKTFELLEAPEALTAFISADSKYWLYINGVTVVFDGSVKRGPTADGSYYDSVEIAPYLHSGKNTVCVLVWYWGKDKNYSYSDSGRAGFIFEAGSIVTDRSWKVSRNTAYLNGKFDSKSNFRLPEYGIYYDATKEIGDWLSSDFDDSAWKNATELGKGGCSPWGNLYPRGIPMLKDYGLKDYENSSDYVGITTKGKQTITLDIPYNAQCTPYLKINAKAGKRIRILTENTWIGSVSNTYITKDGEQEFEALGWFNGEHITYVIPSDVTILELKYRETGYDTQFSGIFECEDEKLNTLWQKALRTLYVTMRDNFMDCPDRERAQWWGDVTSEMAMSMYALDANSYLLYQKGVASMLGHIDPETNVMQTVVPIGEELYELPVQQLAGICGFWTYYLYTGDTDFLKTVYDASVNYVNLWTVGDNHLVEHREGSWDWMDWGKEADTTAIENAWYYYALSSICNMAQVIGENSDNIQAKMSEIKTGYKSLWTERGYQSDDVKAPDDRANALAVISGLADEDKYEVITSVLIETQNSSPYMEYYVLEALCLMGKYDEAKSRMLQRYEGMIAEDYSTLWEKWNRHKGTSNHAWSGGPLVIMSKYLAGVRPIKAGYSKFIIKPQLTSPDTVKCIVPSVKGYISVTETKSDSGFMLDATVPKDTTAIIYLPYDDGQKVKLNDTFVYRDNTFVAADGVEFVEVGNGYIMFSVSPRDNVSLHFEAID